MEPARTISSAFIWLDFLDFQMVLNKWHISNIYLLGNALLLAGPPEQFIQTMKTTAEKYGQLGRLHIGTRPNVYVGSCPEAYEKILSSNKQITKVDRYKYMEL